MLFTHVRRQSIAVALLAAGVVLGGALSPVARAQQVIVFDAPGASPLAGLGTEAVSINASGTAIGNFADGTGAVHGYVRSREGKFAIFDAPGATSLLSATCEWGSGGTCPNSINNAGVVVGQMTDANGNFHGFVRSPEGRLTSFDVAGAGTGSYQGTFVATINNRGTIAGTFADTNNVSHCYVRSGDGEITTFDAPSASQIAGAGTGCNSMNDAGAVVGTWVDANYFTHGFIRSPNGEITEFDPPGSVGGAYGLGWDFINSKGEVTGAFLEAGTNIYRGFVRTPAGKFTVFDIPGAGSAAFQGTFVWAINDRGEITGFLDDSSGEVTPYIREPDGEVTVYRLPNQFAAPNSFRGGAAFGINASGAVVGFFNDVNHATRGYIRLPD
jgi:hypothetical protein